MSQQQIAQGALFAKTKSAAARQSDERRQHEKEEIVRKIIRNQKKKAEASNLDAHAEADATFWSDVKEKMIAEVATTRISPHRKSRIDVKIEQERSRMSELSDPKPTCPRRAYEGLLPSYARSWLTTNVP